MPAGPLERVGPNTITDDGVLRAEVQATRDRGYALADGEMEAGLAGIGVPILDDHECLAALCVSGPAYRVTPAAVEAFLPACDASRAAIEAQIVGDPTAPRPRPRA
jgi:DNA-binding IclR family transcriptional regulator